MQKVQNEIGIANWAEGETGTQEEVIEAEDRKDNCEHTWPGSCVPNGRGDCEQERRQNGLEMSQQEEIQPDCDCYRQNCNAVPENRRHGWRGEVQNADSTAAPLATICPKADTLSSA